MRDLERIISVIFVISIFPSFASLLEGKIQSSSGGMNLYSFIAFVLIPVAVAYVSDVLMTSCDYQNK